MTPSSRSAASVVRHRCNIVNRQMAQRDFCFRAMMTAVDVLERKARAEFEGGERAAGYQRLFAKTPSQLGKTTIETRPQVFEAFVAEVESEDTPAVLAKPAKSASAAWGAYQTAYKRFLTAQAALAKAREKETEAKHDNITALRKLEGKLTDRFPEDLQRVRSYSPQSKARKAKVVVAPAGAEAVGKA